MTKARRLLIPLAVAAIVLAATLRHQAPKER
jgi:hypothetical protein